MQRFLAVFCAVLLLSACYPMSVNTQSDPAVDLSSYRSYDWLPEKSDPKDEQKHLTIKQFKFAVERELQAKGISRDAAKPDFLISFYGDSKQVSTERTVENSDYWGDRERYPYYANPRSRDYDQRWKYQNRNSGSYTRTVETQTIEYKEGTLVIDFLDAQSKELIWRAKIQAIVNEEDIGGQIDKAAVEAITKFSP
ncbi:MAG: DUF4136 domain-containing protein [Porticoccus sp.]